MKDLKKILFPVDLSEPIKKVIPYAQMMVDRFGAELHLLYIVKGPEYYNIAFSPTMPDLNFDEILSSTQMQMNNFKDEYFMAVTHTKATVEIGNAAEKILEYIRSEAIEMVVMGTHGRKGLNKAIFGSVAERVVKTATVPVMVVNTFTGDQ